MTDIITTTHVINTPYLYQGLFPVPRVTSILNTCYHTDALLYWANSLGFRHVSYKSAMNDSANIGTQCHEAINAYMSNNRVIHEPPKNGQALTAFRGFVQWLNDNTGDISVRMHEHPLICNKFGGTLDALYEIDGKLILVDYKTSNNITFKHFLQLSAYRYMLRVLYNININGAMILQLDKNHIGYKEYKLNLDSIQDHIDFMNQCEHLFLNMVDQYNQINSIEQRFKVMKWG